MPESDSNQGVDEALEGEIVEEGGEQAAGVYAGQLEHALTLVLIGRPQVVAEGRPAAVADEEQAQAPVPAALGGAVAVGGLAGELALAGAAGVVGAGKQGAVDEAHAAAGNQLGDGELHARDLRRQAPQAAAQLRLSGQLREAARQQAPDGAQELAVGDQAGDGLGDGQGDQLLIGGLALRSGTRDR
ncbi:MAG TPA: hypothetical protein VIL79_12610 [Thermoleophilia bacterium]